MDLLLNRKVYLNKKVIYLNMSSKSIGRAISVFCKKFKQSKCKNLSFILFNMYFLKHNYKVKKKVRIAKNKLNDFILKKIKYNNLKVSV